MSLALGLAIYFVVWWTVLFAVLPLGVRTQDEEGHRIAGSVGSAPATPWLLRKFLLTTVVAGVVFAVVYWLMTSGAFPVDAMTDVLLGPR